MALVGVDLGGTYVRAGLVENGRLVKVVARPISSQGTSEEVLSDVISVLESVVSPEVQGLGVGVPSVVDLATGTIYDVQNIPAWKEVPLRKILEDRFNLPVYVNNDANCFAVGEKHFGLGQNFDHLVGPVSYTHLTLPTILRV